MHVKNRRNFSGLGAAKFGSSSGGGSSSAAPAQLPSGYQMVGFNPQAFNSLRPASYKSAMAKTSAGANNPANQPSIIMAPTYSAPAAPPPTITVAPNITTTTAVSPNLQQSFTPQVSPVFQQSSGSGGQSAGTTQDAGGGQSGAGGGSAGPGGSAPTTGQGINASDLLAILSAQAEQARLDREAQAAEQRAQREQEAYYRNQEAMANQVAAAERERQQREAQAAQAAQNAALAVHSQFTGPSTLPYYPTETSSAPAAASNTVVVPVWKQPRYLAIGGAVILGGAILYAATRKRKKGQRK